jgi:hypothetical protein
MNRSFHKIIFYAFTITLILNSGLEAIVKSGLTGWWMMNGTAGDSSDYTHHGTLTGNASFVPGGIDGGGCLLLDGNGDAMIITDYDGLLMPPFISVEAWIWLRSYQTGFRDIYTDSQRFRFCVDNGYLAVYTDQSWWSPTSFRLPKNQWVHVCFTTNGQVKRLYLDGLLKRSELEPGTLTGTGEVGISTPEHSIDALIDQVRIYNRALLEAEVYENYYTDKYGTWDPSLLSLQLTYPNTTGLTLVAGEDIGIQWSATPLAGNTVRVEIFRNDTLKQIVAAGTDNDGYMTWRVSYMLDAGPGYRIKLSSASNPGMQTVGQPFTIRVIGTVPDKKETRIYEYKTLHQPVLDGVLDDLVWEYALPETLLTGGIPGDYGVPWHDFQNQQVIWKGIWNRQTNRITLGIQVFDDIRGIFDNGPGSAYYRPDQDESIEVYIDGDMSGGNYWPLFTTAQCFRVSGENNRDLLHYPDASEYPQPFLGDAFRTWISRGENGNWNCEIELTVFNFFPDNERPLKQGDSIGFDLWANDSDNRSSDATGYLTDNQIGWAYHGPAWKEADEMGILSLGGLLDIPEIYVFMPAGWENGFLQGDSVGLVWQKSPNTGIVQIDLLRGDIFDYTIATRSDGNLTWVIPADQSPADNYRIKVSSTLNPKINAWSEDPFAIRPAPRFVMIIPSAARPVTWYTRTQVRLEWSHQGQTADEISIYLMRNDSLVSTIAQATENDGDFIWTVPDDDKLIQDSLGVQIVSLDDSGITGNSGSVIEIRGSQALELLYPDDPDIVFQKDSTYQILWKAGISGALKIELLRQDSLVMVIADSAQAADRYEWTVPFSLKAGNGYRIRLTILDGSGLSVVSGHPFTVIMVQEIRVSLAWGATGPVPGTEMRIRCQVTGGLDSLFRLDLYSAGAFAMTIDDSVQMSDEYIWIIPETLAGLPACRIRITSCLDPSVYDYSVIQFDIRSASYIDRNFPQMTLLRENYPNPFNPLTVICYDLAAAERVRIRIINLRGECVCRFEADQPAGRFRFLFNANDDSGNALSGGLYFCCFQAGAYSAVRKMVLVR